MKARGLMALLKAAGLKAAARGVQVRTLAHDSRKASRGDLFCALPSASGRHADSVAHVQEALGRGVNAVLAESAVLKAVALSKGIVGIASRDLRGDYASLCSAYFGHPTKRLVLSGITGTNGKTTTSFLLRGLLDATGVKSALIGTVGYWVGKRLHDAPNTTPSALELQGLFAEAVGAGCKWGVMEVSSHALDQRRVEGLTFKAAVFTNLTRDHLDYHKTFAAYGRAKASLFEHLSKDGVAVVNADDPAHTAMAANRTRGARLLRYSAKAGKAELRAEGLQFSREGTRFDLVFEGHREALFLPLPGRFNVSNALAAAGAALGQGFKLRQVAQGLQKPTLPPGRFEMLRLGQPFSVVVDYAHTPDALERLIRASREVSSGRVITVFGCGGDRDRGKRPMMGGLTARLSDLSFATSDNPRTEDPAAILKEVMAGVPLKLRSKVRRVEDRRKAVRSAIAVARPGDTVLIAGKGHEDYQIIGTRKHRFDDRVEAASALRSLGFRGRR